MGAESYNDFVINNVVPVIPLVVIEKVERIIVHVNKEMAPYIKTKPLHPTQKFKKINDQTYEVQLNVIPNLELNSLLLSFGKNLIVQEPLLLKEELEAIISKMKENYQTK